MKIINPVLGGGGFHHVAMSVGNFEETIKFYTQVLGFRESLAWGEGKSRAAMLDTGDGGCLEVFANGEPGGKPEGAFRHIALRTADCRLVLERVRAAGMTVTVEPTDVDIPSQPVTPVTIAFFRGPDGETVELFQNR